RAKKGTSFGIPTEIETELAKLAVSMVPGIDMIRFVNSGTEACMSAVRLARGYSGRDKIIKFAGCYHGHADSFLIQAGSGAVTFGSPNSPGVTQGTARDTLLAVYNDLESVRTLVEANENEIAAVIIEPVAGNMGCIPPDEMFIKGLRQLCTDAGILLIFDEVMTGFRLAAGGAQEVLGIEADILAFGKVIGGGLPVGAFAARTEIMEYLAPVGPVYQAGTLSGNPLAMSAGFAMLSALNNDREVFQRLAEKTEYLHKGFVNCLDKAGIAYQINRMGSMISLHFTSEEVIDFESAARGNNPIFKRYFHAMLREGIYLPPSAFESYFLNDALGYEELDLTIEALEKIVSEIQ
ncbi:MAG: glutamate-1-semialdehyde 2,1-aminomutase, partial [Flavobacteriaceae bacterium]